MKPQSLPSLKSLYSEPFLVLSPESWDQDNYNYFISPNPRQQKSAKISPEGTKEQKHTKQSKFLWGKESEEENKSNHEILGLYQLPHKEVNSCP